MTHLLSVLSAMTYGWFMMKTSIANAGGNCGSCGSDSSNDYLAIEISDMQPCYHGLSYYPVYEFNGWWEVAGDCIEDRAYYAKQVWNPVYEVYESFEIQWNDNQWVIRKVLYSKQWAYCTSDQLSGCSDNWYVEYGYSGYSVAYTLDSSVVTTGVTDDTCGETDVVTPAPTVEDTCDSDYDCVEMSGFWYDGFNHYWSKVGCYNGEAYYECDGSDYNWILFFNNDNEWIVYWDVSETATRDISVAYCNGETDVFECSGNWVVVFSADTNGQIEGSDGDNCGSSGRSDATDTDTTSEDSTIELSIVPYGHSESELDSNNDSEKNELEWWVWLIIGIAILIVIITIVVFALRCCKNGKMNSATDDDKNVYLLAEN